MCIYVKLFRNIQTVFGVMSTTQKGRLCICQRKRNVHAHVPMCQVSDRNHVQEMGPLVKQVKRFRSSLDLRFNDDESSRKSHEKKNFPAFVFVSSTNCLSGAAGAFT